MNMLIVGLAGHSGLGAETALRGSCVAALLCAGLILMGLAAYYVSKAPGYR